VRLRGKESSVSISSRSGRRALCVGAIAAAASVWAVAAATAAAPPARNLADPQFTPAATTAVQLTSARGSAVSAVLVRQLALARMATAKYVSDLKRAKADGYVIITKMIPNMGYHFLNPKVKGFDVRKPAILVYEHQGTRWQLGALEWVYTSKPAKPPLPGAKYGTFGAGCHYLDGTYVPAETQDTCPKASPQTGAKFAFWHPLLFTMHVWLWYPNPSGLFAGTNPLVAPFDKG
jgi:hypothetical protein